MTNAFLVKTFAGAGLALAGLLAAGGAQAGTNVQWSIGINAPIAPGVALGTVISNGPDYYPAPVYVQPAPVAYAPPPVVYAPQPVYVAPRPVYVRPGPVIVHRPVYVRGAVVPRWQGRDGGWQGRDGRWQGRDDGRHARDGGWQGHHDRGYGPIADGRGR